MSKYSNHLGQPIGFPVPSWSLRARPPLRPMEGHYCRVEPIDPGRHAADLHDANRTDEEGRIWTYLPYGPFDTFQAYLLWMERNALGADPMFHAIVERRTNKAVGVASYLRINPDHGVIEVGHINYSPLLQRTPAGTEAMFLMMRRAFDELGYRRYEWKCDALNAASCAAAERLGFRFEGVFRQAMLYKGRNRDSAWYAIIDKEWPAIKAAFERWLDPSNFDEQDRQRLRLTTLTAMARDGTA
ncbi:MAG: GNAT family N-acetyltransferase [Proteobacteria bacterium]|nr:GNAT family N-acetyltransferase [Pseudomonadota bacterium]